MLLEAGAVLGEEIDNAVGLRRQLLGAGYPKLAKRVVQQNVRRRRWAHAASAKSLRGFAHAVALSEQKLASAAGTAARIASAT